MKTTIIPPHKSSLGMDANVTALVIFIAVIAVGWIPILGWFAWAVPLVFFYLEKSSEFVKIQAVYALIIGIVRAVIAFACQILVWILTPNALELALRGYLGRTWGIWTLFTAFSAIVGLAFTVLLIYFMVMAYTYKQVDLPILGPIAAKASEKMKTININVTVNNPPPSGGEPDASSAPAASGTSGTPDSDGENPG